MVNDLPAKIVTPVDKATEADTAMLAPGAEGAQDSSSDDAELDLAALAKQLFVWARDNAELKIIPAVERELIIQALSETKGNQVQAAKLLGITRATLRKRVEKFEIKQEFAAR